MRTPTLRRGTAQRCTAGVVMLMLAAGTVGLAVASDDEPAEAEASAAIESLPAGPTASPSASSSPSSGDDAKKRAADGERTERPTSSPPVSSTPGRSSQTEPSPSTRRTSAAPSPTGAAPTAERPSQSAPAPSPTPTREARERGAIGDLLAGLLGQD